MPRGCSLRNKKQEGKIKTMRLDKFLKVSRLIKRRTVANEACDAGRVMVNGKTGKGFRQCESRGCDRDRIWNKKCESACA